MSLPLGLGGTVTVTTSHPEKLFRIGGGEITLINGWADGASARPMQGAEHYARKRDQDGDTYLLLNVVTGDILRHFRFENPTEKRLVEVAR